MLNLPFLLLTDSYKAGHFLQYPTGTQEMSAYMECRGALSEAGLDHRIVFTGIRYLYETIISRQVTLSDIIEADKYFAQHEVMGAYPWPRDLWLDVVLNHNGYLPFRIETLDEGTVIHPHVPFLIIHTETKFAPLVTWLETVMSHLWSPMTTATKSAHIKEYIRRKFETSVDESMYFLLDSRLHDFGFRGTSSIETAMTAGMGHLLSFDGTDTLIAGWKATSYNDGKVIGKSVRATEHSVMTSHPDELSAIRQMIATSPDGSILSIVADSYDYNNFLDVIVPQIVDEIKAHNMTLVVRPDSGDFMSNIENGLTKLAKHFGYTINSKGYKVLTNCAMIQGDGMSIDNIFRLADMVESLKFSAQNIAYGMGGGLLQKQDRDTLRIATKLSFIRDSNGVGHDVMKHPKTDSNKFSLPGEFKVVGRFNTDNDKDQLVVKPKNSDWVDNESNYLRVIWNCGPTDYKWQNFQEVRDSLAFNWKWSELNPDVISPELKAKIKSIVGS